MGMVILSSRLTAARANVRPGCGGAPSADGPGVGGPPIAGPRRPAPPPSPARPPPRDAAAQRGRRRSRRGREPPLAVGPSCRTDARLRATKPLLFFLTSCCLPAFVRWCGGVGRRNQVEFSPVAPGAFSGARHSWPLASAAAVLAPVGRHFGSCAICYEDVPLGCVHTPFPHLALRFIMNTMIVVAEVLRRWCPFPRFFHHLMLWCEWLTLSLLNVCLVFSGRLPNFASKRFESLATAPRYIELPTHTTFSSHHFFVPCL